MCPSLIYVHFFVMPVCYDVVRKGNEMKKSQLRKEKVEMDISYESGLTDYRNKDAVLIGFAKYKQLDNTFSEIEKQLQNGWFLLHVGNETRTEEENLAIAKLLNRDLLSLQFKHIPLFAVYERKILQGGAQQNKKQILRKELFVMVPYEKDFTEKFYLEAAKMFAAKNKQNCFFTKSSSESKIIKFQRENSSGIIFTECESMCYSVEEIMEKGVLQEEYQCVFKGYRKPASWIDAVVMERNGMLWH